MKSAYWCLAVVVLGLFGLILLNLFGDITVTNQQDYTIMKNSVEAAMYDSIDQTSYKKGFCVCTNKEKDYYGRYVFKDRSEYTVENLSANAVDCSGITSKTNCEFVLGEIKLDEQVFIESFIRRFSSNIKGDKEYKINVKEVIEYPPKVSIEIRSANNTNVLNGNFSSEDFDIVNKIDSILEYGGKVKQKCKDKYETGLLSCGGNSKCKQYNKSGKETTDVTQVYKTVTTITGALSNCDKYHVQQVITKTDKLGTFNVNYVGYSEKSTTGTCGEAHVMFVLDASSSISKSEYESIKTYATDFSDKIVKKGGLVGMVIFNEGVRKTVALKNSKLSGYPSKGTGSRAMSGLSEALYQLGFIDGHMKSSYDGKVYMDGTIVSRNSSIKGPTANSYIVFLGDGYYNGHDWANYFDYSRDNNTLINKMNGWSDKLTRYVIFFNKGSSADYNKAKLIAGGAGNTYASKNLSDISKAFESIEGSIPKATGSTKAVQLFDSRFNVANVSNNKIEFDLTDPNVISNLNKGSYNYTISMNTKFIPNTEGIISAKFEIQESNSTIDSVEKAPISYRGCE